MTAKEAKELSISNKKDLDSIMETISVMAKNGNNYATIETKKIKYPEEYSKALKDMGYEVNITDYFSITW